MWFLSEAGHVPTPNVCSDTWEPVESSVIHMLVACRLKITFTSNLKLIISFLVYTYYYMQLEVIICCCLKAAHLFNIAYGPEVANRPSAGTSMV
jgi:hypothetical protein